MIARRPVLIVEADDTTRRSLTRKFDRLWPVVAGGTLTEALMWLRTGCPTCAVVGAELPDGHGAEVLTAIRDSYPWVPILATARGHDQAQFVRTAQRIGAEYSGNPSQDAIAHFARRQAIREHVRCEALLRAVDGLASTNKFSLRETELLALACLFYSYSKIANRLGTGEETVRAQAQTLAAKSGKTLKELAYDLRSRHCEESDHGGLSCVP